MVKGLVVDGNQITHMIALPYLVIPASIKDYLNYQSAVGSRKARGQLQVEIAEINEEERQAFLAMAQEDWKGL
jgi:hypothetical protein